jgi:hypothetical protein
MWPSIGGVALIAFLTIGSPILAITYVRRRRRIGRGPSPYAAPDLRIIHGGFPPQPKPEWVHWPEAFASPDGGSMPAPHS